MAAESEEMTSGFPPNLPLAGDVLETEMHPLPVGPDSADASPDHRLLQHPGDHRHPRLRVSGAQDLGHLRPWHKMPLDGCCLGVRLESPRGRDLGN